MAIIPIHRFFVFNGSVQPVSEFIVSENEGGIYEVLRVVNGIPLFLEDHLLRLAVSAKIAKKEIRFLKKEIESFIHLLIRNNEVFHGNIMISCKTNLKLFFIPHKYPTESFYTDGVRCGILKAERDHPNAKVFQTNVRQQANKIIDGKNYFEVLLVNENEMITEGSRSNVFFVKNEILFTPPGHEVLLGITRQKTIALAKQLKIKCFEKEINMADLQTFDAAFITGTSPKILPVSNVNKVVFDTKNSILQGIIRAYDELIVSYVKKKT